MRIGIDLDNTIIFYDDAFINAARARGLIPSHFSGTKQQVRDHIRALENGETQWQALQGYVYGAGISQATLFDGVSEFFTRARSLSHELYIISHKTEFGHYDKERINLREAATHFLKQSGLDIAPSHLLYNTTRSEKIEALAKLQLSWFIDDLVEVFEEPHFPPETKKILFHTAPNPPSGNWISLRTWNDITSLLLA